MAQHPHPGMQKFDGLIIDPDIESRMRLKQVCASLVNFGKVYPLQSATEGIAKLGVERHCDVIFVSSKLGQDNVSTFIKDAKATQAGQDTAYILIVANKDSGSALIAQSVMMGADGVLTEPYSVDILVEITQLSARVRKERSTAREMAALKILLADMVQQIDLIAFSKSCEYEVGTSFKHLKQACAVLAGLEAESLTKYYELAIEAFGAAPVPVHLQQRKKYGGASNRIKKRMADKLATEVQKVASTPPKP
jgi:DNA-binding NarL/FixJ family response regulator